MPITDNRGPWVGVDLDGTLAWHDQNSPMVPIGQPVPRMVARVKAWLKAGTDVRIVTARVSLVNQTQVQVNEAEKLISAWCVEHLGQTLPITCAKDFDMVTLYDDRAVQVISNTGITVRFEV